MVDETISALRSLQRAGKARFIGITGFPLGIYKAVMSRVQVDVVLSYCHYSLNNTSLDRIACLFEEHKVGVVNASPLSMGLLTSAGPPSWHPASEEIKGACAQAARYCDEQGADLASLALQFAISNSAVHTTLVGMATRDEVERNVAATAVEPSPSLLEAVQQILSPVRDRSWSAPGQKIKDEEFSG